MTTCLNSVLFPLLLPLQLWPIEAWTPLDPWGHHVASGTKMSEADLISLAGCKVGLLRIGLVCPAHPTDARLDWIPQTCFLIAFSQPALTYWGCLSLGSDRRRLGGRPSFLSCINKPRQPVTLLLTDTDRCRLGTPCESCSFGNGLWYNPSKSGQTITCG